jgi:hypothetical protein
MRQVNTDFVGDPEYEEFLVYTQNKAHATAKSYKTSYRKLRNLLGKPIRETAQETLFKTIQTAIENINSQQALLNIGIICREQFEPKLPVDTLVKFRDQNKETVQEMIKMNNQFIVLPSLGEFDNYLEILWVDKKYKEYIINFLIRHHYVRNKDLLFDTTEKKSDIDQEHNWLWIDRRNQRCVYYRNDYKTASTYGPKTSVIDNERFLKAAKMCHKKMDEFPITDSEEKIGYHIQKMTFRKLGEGALLKIIVNHYKGDISRLKEISNSRGTNLPTLLQSYNISYTD